MNDIYDSIALFSPLSRFRSGYNAIIAGWYFFRLQFIIVSE